LASRGQHRESINRSLQSPPHATIASVLTSGLTSSDDAEFQAISVQIQPRCGERDA
jgi:hypothetical protein